MTATNHDIALFVRGLAGPCSIGPLPVLDQGTPMQAQTLDGLCSRSRFGHGTRTTHAVAI